MEKPQAIGAGRYLSGKHQYMTIIAFNQLMIKEQGFVVVQPKQVAAYVRKNQHMETILVRGETKRSTRTKQITAYPLLALYAVLSENQLAVKK